MTIKSMFIDGCDCFKKWVKEKLADFEEKIIGMTRSVETWNEIDDPQGTVHWPDGNGNIKIWIPRRYPPKQIVSSDKLFEVHIDDELVGTVNGLTDFVEKVEGQIEQVENDIQSIDTEIINIKDKNHEQDDTDTYLQSQINVTNQNVVNLVNTKLNKNWPNAPQGYVATLDANHNFIPMEPSGGGGSGDWDEARIEAIEIKNLDQDAEINTLISDYNVQAKTVYVGKDINPYQNSTVLIESADLYCGLKLVISGNSNGPASVIVTPRYNHADTSGYITGTCTIIAPASGSATLSNGVNILDHRYYVRSAQMDTGNIGSNTSQYKKIAMNGVMHDINNGNIATDHLAMKFDLFFGGQSAGKPNLVVVMTEIYMEAV